MARRPARTKPGPAVCARRRKRPRKSGRIMDCTQPDATGRPFRRLVLGSATRPRSHALRQVAFVVLGFLTTSPAAAQTPFTLYDPTAGTLPAAQPWLAYADNAILTGGSASQA